MNRLIIIGNIGNSPELRTTPAGIAVCTFSVAVPARKKDDPATWFRVTAWRQLGELCNRYLSKGRKVAVVGSVALKTYEANDGSTRASLEVTADEVEFLSPAQEAKDKDAGFERVDEPLPF